MVNQLETRLDLAKHGVSSEMLNEKFDDSLANNVKTKKMRSPPSKKELEDYEMIKILENRDQVAED